MSRIAVLFAAAMLAGCSGGDDGSFTLVTDIAFWRTPYGGTFTVSDASDALGCSRGAFVNKPTGGKPPTAIRKVFSCTKGDRRGKFIIRFGPGPLKSKALNENETVVTPWRFEGGTGDFSGIEGEGSFSAKYDYNTYSGVETLTGNVAF